MFPGKRKKPQKLPHNLQILRSVSHSHAMNETSIVLDASNYIKELKHKVERVTEEIATTETSLHQNHHHHELPRISVETLERGFLVNVVNSGKSSPGLLLPVLATFEDLGLEVLEARASCAHTFHLQAFGGQNEDEENYMDAPMVKQAIYNTIKGWNESIQ